MGVAIAKGILEKKGMRIVGAVDTLKDLMGKDLGEILNLNKRVGINVTNDAQSLMSQSRPDIAIIATRSSVQGIYPELAMCIKAGVNVVSTCGNCHTHTVASQSCQPRSTHSRRNMALRCLELE